MIAFKWRVFLLLPALAGILYCQSPALYILLKTTVSQPGPARDAFLVRMTALGISNVKFVDTNGVVAVRCTAPATANTLIAADADVAGVLPIEGSKEPDVPAPAVPVLPVTPISTPPYAPPQAGFPQAGGIGLGGGTGMNLAITMLTDIAGGAIVKLLTPTPGCKVVMTGVPRVVPARGGTTAFEVKASGNCAWQAVSTADWLQITSGVLGPGTAAVTITVSTHPAGKRQAAVILQAVGGTGPLHGKTVLMVTQE